MPRYRIYIDLADESTLTEALGYLTILGPIEAIKVITSKENRKRNTEIVRKYTSNPKKYSSEALAQEYHISRERICQILRRNNTIETVRVRRQIAVTAAKEASKQVKAEADVLWEQRMQEAIRKVRDENISYRQAAIAVGMEGHSNFTMALNRRAHLAGVHSKRGRWLHRTDRIAKVVAAHNEGLSIPAIVKKLRAEGDDHLYEQWVYRYFPSYIKRPRKKKAPDDPPHNI